MGTCRTVSGILIALFAVLIGYGYREASQPDPPTDTAAIIAEGGKFVTLRDGRILEYFTTGPENADTNVLVVHGAIQTGKFYANLRSGQPQHQCWQLVLGQKILPNLPGTERGKLSLWGLHMMLFYQSRMPENSPKL